MEKTGDSICKVEITRQAHTYSDPGPAVGFIFGTYSLMSWLSMIGVLSPHAALMTGIFQFLYAIGFLVCSILNIQKGNPFGALNMVFAVAFGMVGGANQICSIIFPLKGIPFDGMIGSIFFLLSGIYLLFVMPGMLNIPKYLFIAYLAGAIGLILTGVAGIFSLAWMFPIAGWVLFITGAGGLYSSICGTNAELGLKWPPEGSSFKK